MWRFELRYHMKNTPICIHWYEINLDFTFKGGRGDRDASGSIRILFRVGFLARVKRLKNGRLEPTGIKH